jgi:hypothetical protein
MRKKGEEVRRSPQSIFAAGKTGLAQDAPFSIERGFHISRAVEDADNIDARVGWTKVDYVVAHRKASQIGRNFRLPFTHARFFGEQSEGLVEFIPQAESGSRISFINVGDDILKILPGSWIETDVFHRPGSSF